jgi:hypothetical protein
MKKNTHIMKLALGLAAAAGLLAFAGAARAQASVVEDSPALSSYTAAECQPPVDRPATGTPGWWGRLRAWLAEHPRAGARIRNALADRQAELEISPEEALRIAQAYLDENQPGAVAEPAARPGPRGYYHFLVMVDGEVVGRLHVNGHNGEVFDPAIECPDAGAETAPDSQ